MYNISPIKVFIYGERNWNDNTFQNLSSNYQINMRDFPSGMYILKIASGDSIATKKFINHMEKILCYA